MSEADVAVVKDFLEAMAVPDLDRCLALITDDIEWRNTGLPTLRGKRVATMLRGMVKRKVGFGVDFHDLHEADGKVVTKRTDYLQVFKVRQTIEVTGYFTVRDGRVAVWDDRFSWVQLLKDTRLGGRIRG